MNALFDLISKKEATAHCFFKASFQQVSAMRKRVRRVIRVKKGPRHPSLKAVWLGEALAEGWQREGLAVWEWKRQQLKRRFHTALANKAKGMAKPMPKPMPKLPAAKPMPKPPAAKPMPKPPAAKPMPPQPAAKPMPKLLPWPSPPGGWDLDSETEEGSVSSATEMPPPTEWPSPTDTE